jgi:6-phosphogluconate dehydrogenase
VQLGMIGLGRMGASMARRLMKAGHQCVAYDRQESAVAAMVEDGATGSGSPQEFVDLLSKPRIIWLMVPAAFVDQTISELVPMLDAGDILIDGGNSFYQDDMRRGGELHSHGVHYVDVGTSGGVAGLDRGYCLMIGGESDIVDRLRPIFSSLAPGIAAVARTPGRSENPGNGERSAEEGFLHCGPHGAGHFVKMVHNGIEYGLMAAYAEGFNILRNANIGSLTQSHDAETTPLRHPEFYRYDLNLSDITELWRRGSVIGSWLLDLSAIALRDDAELTEYGGHVSDSGEGRWTLQAAIDEGVPTPVLSAALHERFASRGNADFSNRVLSAMRHQFGGHVEKNPNDAKQH